MIYVMTMEGLFQNYFRSVLARRFKELTGGDRTIAPERTVDGQWSARWIESGKMAYLWKVIKKITDGILKFKNSVESDWLFKMVDRHKENHLFPTSPSVGRSRKYDYLHAGSE
jgi:hypothetical protein